MLEWKECTVGYGNKTVLRNLSVSFDVGKFTTVIGPNGCGKSTLLRSAAGLLLPTSGQVLLDGFPLAQQTKRQTAKRVSYLSQGRFVPNMTVEQLTLHGRFPYAGYLHAYSAEDRAIARRAIEAVGLEEVAEEPLSALSGGMRQLAYIAMALTQDTDYILLDEPTTYLDIGHQLLLMERLRALADGGKGIVAVLHDLPLAFSFADEILVMKEGAFLLRGDPQTVCQSPILREVFGVSLAWNGTGYAYELLPKTM
ncbi:MAG: ABC transporter ATP-binding protein [Clostridia bacterium]|nr:ABC transporter ATP-binding protein [Clostridia bacterium]